MTPRTQSLLARFLSEAPGRSVVTVPLGRKVEAVLDWEHNPIVDIGKDSDEAISKALEAWSRSVPRMRASVKEMCAVVGVESRGTQ